MRGQDMPCYSWFRVISGIESMPIKSRISDYLSMEDLEQDDLIGMGISDNHVQATGTSVRKSRETLL